MADTKHQMVVFSFILGVIAIWIMDSLKCKTKYEISFLKFPKNRVRKSETRSSGVAGNIKLIKYELVEALLSSELSNLSILAHDR